MSKPATAHAKRIGFGLILGIVTYGAGAWLSAAAAENDRVVPESQRFQPRIVEGYPAAYITRLKEREKKILGDLGDNRHSSAVSHGLIILKTDEWSPGTKITVAFDGGTPRLHALIERIVAEWSQYADIEFDFGRDANGVYRSWSEQDEDYKADVRIGFQATGYWSAVGRDSINRKLNEPGAQTMNLQGFDVSLPFGFEGIILHEFGHVLALEHEHQSPTGVCDFRWDDDSGYVKTTDQSGQFIPDKQGHHPGIYTVFGGPPNNWSKDQIDYNLRPLTSLDPTTPVSDYGIGPFDKLSIMKYYYDDWMFLSGKNSPCYSPGENYDLSTEDKKRIALSYPKDVAAAAMRMQAKREAVESVLSQVPQSSLLAKELQIREQQIK
jgi:hypothetical protein